MTEATVDAVDFRATWSLCGVEVLERGPEDIALLHQFGRSNISGAPHLEVVLRALVDAELDDDEIVALAAASSSASDAPPVEVTLRHLSRVLGELAFLVERAVYAEDEFLVRLRPIGEQAGALDDELTVSGMLELSRFAYQRSMPGGTGPVLFSPLSLHRAEIGAAMQSVLHTASTGVDAARLAAPMRAAVGLLVTAGFLASAGTEAADARLATWSFHDLVFHGLSRPGRSDEPFGAQMLHLDVAAPPPTPRREGTRVALAAPDIEATVAADRSLTEVLESRHSVRSYGEAPPTVAELGALLWRCQRVRGIVPVEYTDGFDGVDRPYPTGGMSGDLELHLVVSRCTGLTPALYAYDAARHELVHEAELDAGIGLQEDARRAAGGTFDPPILIVITSRFARISWKYERIAYALTLKHVGVLVQTIYLVATAMGLGACALGSGNASAAADAFGLDWLTESSVGEIALGRDPAPSWRRRFATDSETEQRSS